MKILFLTIFPQNLKCSHSGVNSFLYAALCNKFDTVAYGAPEKIQRSLGQSCLNKLFSKLGGKKFLPLHNVNALTRCAKQLKRVYDKVNPDIIITTSPLSLAFLDFSCPALVYTDATVPSMLDYYPQFTDIRDDVIDSAKNIEHLGFSKSSHSFFASNWACESAKISYGLPPDKVSVIPRPRNISTSDMVNEISPLIQTRFDSPNKRFLFVGVDWIRKGGDLAFKIIQDLSRTHDVSLDVVGVNPKSIPESQLIKFYGFLHKSNEEEYTKLKCLYRDSFAFILPTQAEAMGISYNEAASYGLPLIANNTGGVSTIVNYDNGIFLNELGYHQSMMKIKTLLTNYESYHKMSLASYNTAKALPTWDEALNIMLGKL